MVAGLFDFSGGEPGALATMIRLAARMPQPTRNLWESRFRHVYGDLGGQRKVDLSRLKDRYGVRDATATIHDVLFGVQSYFVLVADALALSALQADAIGFFRASASLERRGLRSFLATLSSGRALEECGVFGARDAFDFDWYVSTCNDSDLDSIASTFGFLADRWQQLRIALLAPDPLSTLYSSLLPRNLLHVLGEVYTPCWLAEMLLIDAAWTPGTRMLDPFAGSGAFALAALRIGGRLGVSATQILPGLCLVDLNPVACAAARANLVITVSRDPDFVPGRTDIHLPVLSADTLGPAVLARTGASVQTEAGTLLVDGESVAVPFEANGTVCREAVRAQLARYHVDLGQWLSRSPSEDDCLANQAGTRASTRDRRTSEQMAVLCLEQADLIATNPPWVGWEYMSRPHRRYLEPAWTAYELFTARGREASFVKEDLSTLAMAVAWDRHLRPGGTSVAVLRTNTMTSTLAARGLRRLSVYPDRDPLRLEHVRVFKGLKVFSNAQVDVATWLLRKGTTTCFPIRVTEVGNNRFGSQPPADRWLEEVSGSLTSRECVAERVTPDDPGSRWIIGHQRCVEDSRTLTGTSRYTGRTGVFTGGANAVYYLDPCRPDGSEPVGWFNNVTTRAKRRAPSVKAQLERDLVFEVIRGRDIDRWSATPGASLLCPHTPETRMQALAPAVMQAQFPHAWRYLKKMRPILDERKGFTPWEKSFREQAFYAIQRIGSYTFAPYKVTWRYIANDFVIAVAGPGEDDKPRLPNDKVIFVGLDDKTEAYYLAALLSSDPVRWKVVAYAACTQISANAIAPLKLPEFDNRVVEHRLIAAACERGHQAITRKDIDAARVALSEVNRHAAVILGIGSAAMTAFHAELRRLYPFDWTMGTRKVADEPGTTDSQP